MNQTISGSNNLLRNADVGHMLELREKLAVADKERDEARKEAEGWRDCFQTGMSMQVRSPSKVFPWEEKQSPNSKPWLNEAAALGKETRKKEESS
tara:strand:+ start:72 stop:356 length:285 start_codon:yes stop_codon:yes gene_type:complete